MRRTYLVLIVLCGLTAGSFLPRFLPIARAQTSVTTQSKIDAQNAEIAKLEAQIEIYKNQLVITQSTSKTLTNSVKELDLNQKKLETNSRLIEEKIKKTNLQLGKIGGEISNNKDTINGLQTAVRQGARQLEEGDRTSFLVYLLRKETLSDAWHEFDAVRTIEAHLNTNIKKLSMAKSDLELKKTDTEKEKQQIVALKKDLETQKKVIEANRSEKARLLRDTNNQESAYRQMITESEKKKDQFESEVRKIEEGIKYTLNPKDLPVGIAFSWPLEKIIITQKFGVTASSGRLYKSGSHNGVDFGATFGTPVYAMADGTIAGIGDTDVQCPRISFGRFILTKYTNGLASTYAHLSVISVSAGQNVVRGQLLGYSGNTGYSTGPHLHVSVYPVDAVNLKTLPSISCKGKILTQPISAVGAYLDALKYLPK